jgi:hypothetical protein
VTITASGRGCIESGEVSSEKDCEWTASGSTDAAGRGSDAIGGSERLVVEQAGSHIATPAINAKTVSQRGRSGRFRVGRRGETLICVRSRSM